MRRKRNVGEWWAVMGRDGQMLCGWLMVEMVGEWEKFSRVCIVALELLVLSCSKYAPPPPIQTKTHQHTHTNAHRLVYSWYDLPLVKAYKFMMWPTMISWCFLRLVQHYSTVCLNKRMVCLNKKNTRWQHLLVTKICVCFLRLKNTESKCVGVCLYTLMIWPTPVKAYCMILIFLELLPPLDPV